MSAKIVHASIDEHKKIKGGEPGDQTGKEVCTRNWYEKGWDIMLHYPDEEISKQVSKIAVKLAKSNLVGYNQNKRNTLYKELKANDFNVDKYIKSKVKTDTDCSAFIYACWCCVVHSMRTDTNAPTTKSMRNFYKKHGFTVYTDRKYLTTDVNLKAGDINVKEGSHTVMVYENKSNTNIYYPVCTINTVSIVDGLKSIGVDSSYANRKLIAIKNGIDNYKGLGSQNSELLKKLKAGTLLMV